VDVQSNQYSQPSRSLFELAAFHVCFLTREVSNVKPMFSYLTKKNYVIILYHSFSLSLSH
jgi:hypothetical protein